jgi:hypothetical protein
VTRFPIPALALASALVVGMAVRFCPVAAPLTARLAFDPTTFAATPPDVASALGGPLTTVDIEKIGRVSRAELERAFEGLRIHFTDDGHAFWRLLVVPAVARPGLSGRPIQNAAGMSYPLGPLGGGGFLNFTTLALKAVVYAPPGTSRDGVVTAIGRGVGRSAVHEFTHLILGGRTVHSNEEDSYEYDSADRASQYYGELRWTLARPLLEQRLGSPLP